MNETLLLKRPQKKVFYKGQIFESRVICNSGKVENT